MDNFEQLMSTVQEQLKKNPNLLNKLSQIIKDPKMEKKISSLINNKDLEEVVPDENNVTGVLNRQQRRKLERQMKKKNK